MRAASLFVLVLFLCPLAAADDGTGENLKQTVTDCEPLPTVGAFTNDELDGFLDKVRRTSPDDSSEMRRLNRELHDAPVEKRAQLFFRRIDELEALARFLHDVGRGDRPPACPTAHRGCRHRRGGMTDPHGTARALEELMRRYAETRRRCGS